MIVQLRHVGESREPVVVIDQFSGMVDRIVAMAADLQPFPKSPNAYPGLRRVISPEDADATRYVGYCLRRVGPTLGRIFGAQDYSSLEASFSLVTTLPDELSPEQTIPHFDSLDPNYIALLHYLADCDGTAFYRQQATGIERLTADNHAIYRDHLVADEDVAPGYIAASTPQYEQIGTIPGLVDRAILYRGALLHSGVILPDAPLQSDPRRGRLTANMFIQIR